MEFQQSADELKSYLISSLIYPSLLTVVGGASIIVLLELCGPQVRSDFRGCSPGAAPTNPNPAGCQQFHQDVLVVVSLGLCSGCRRASSASLVRRKGVCLWDRMKLRIFLLGDVLRKIEVARISKTLGTLIHNAVPLVHSLNIVREISGNSVISKAIGDIADGVKKGEGVAKPMLKTGVFPQLAVHLVEVGEETGGWMLC